MSTAEHPHLLLCNGAAATGADREWRRVAPTKLWTRPDRANVTLRVGHVADAIAADLRPRVVDLIEIAAMVYAADQAARRVGPLKFDYGDRWRRRFRFEVAVRDPQFWSDPQVGALLADTLAFLSDDYYEFAFHPMADPPPVNAYFDFARAGAAADPVERVMLFSGGLDSLAGAVEEIMVRRRRVALVSHQPVQHMGARQRDLVDQLRLEARRAGAPQPLHFTVRAHKAGWEAADTTQRTRSFLFGSIALAVTQLFGLDRLHFYENGIVSINLPLCAQEVGGRATRTTHPRVLAGYGALFARVVGRPFTVDNEYLWRTKQDVLHAMKVEGYAWLARGSASCMHTRQHTQLRPHCGACSQCFSRRFAALGAGYGDDDPPGGYVLDVMRDARPRDEDRILAERWVGTAMRMAKVATLEQFRRAFAGELARVCPYVPPSPDDAVAKLYDLHLTHARQVAKVLADEARDQVESLFTGRLAPTSTLRYAYNLTCLAGTAPAAGTGAPELAGEQLVLPVPADGAPRRVGPRCRVQLQGPGEPVLVMGKKKPRLTEARYAVIQALVESHPDGLKKDVLENVRPSARAMLATMKASDKDWAHVIHLPGGTGGRYRVR